MTDSFLPHDGRRILVFGNSGAGKSTLAKRLQRELDIFHLDLDPLAWLPTSPPTRRDLDSANAQIRESLAAYTHWVVEGCYADLLHLLLDDADAMYFLNPGNEVCIANCRARPWEPHKYATKEEQDSNLDFLLEWVKSYSTRDDEMSLSSHRRLFSEFRGSKYEVVDGNLDRICSKYTF